MFRNINRSEGLDYSLWTKRTEECVLLQKLMAGLAEPAHANVMRCQVRRFESDDKSKRKQQNRLTATQQPTKIMYRWSFLNDMPSLSVAGLASEAMYVYESAPPYRTKGRRKNKSRNSKRDVQKPSATATLIMFERYHRQSQRAHHIWYIPTSSPPWWPSGLPWLM